MEIHRTMTSKAIILAGGMGTRMQRAHPSDDELGEEAARLADKGLKGLIPVAGRPFLDYVIGSLLESGSREICLVIPPANAELQEYIRDTEERTGARVTWAIQDEPLGTAHALLSARDFAGSDPFVMCNCDNLYPREALFRLSAIADDRSYVVAFDRDALLRESNFGGERVSRFAVVVVDANGQLEDIVEKPDDPERYMCNGKLRVGMNLYRFTPEIFLACERIDPDPERGELELTAAVLLLARERQVQVLFSSGPVIDMTGRGDIGAAQELLRERSPGF
jgi:glucose-1-phosphate thymidylyltransferase